MTPQPDRYAAHPNEGGRPDAEQRRDWLLALLVELEQRGVRPRLELEIAGVRVLCCGADGTFTFVTETGDILGRDKHLTVVAENLAQLAMRAEE